MIPSDWDWVISQWRESEWISTSSFFSVKHSLSFTNFRDAVDNDDDKLHGSVMEEREWKRDRVKQNIN